jgi:1,2-dihydroxy-3-keto-5-methylthiopentene dioxygenase
MEEEMSPERRAQEEAEIRARDDRRRREEAERKKRVEDERKAEEKRVQQEKMRRLEEERRRLKQEEELKKLGSDKIMPLPPVPPSCLDERDPTAMKAWLLDPEVSKPTLRRLSLKPGRKPGPNSSVTLAQLKELGVVYFRVNLNDFSLVNQIVKERCYKHTDEVRVSQTCKDEAYIEKWFVEHMNEDEQIRLVTDGSCYFDIRNRKDEWVRLHVSAGDLIVLPAGMYHRGTLDEDDFCSIMRLFCDSQRWNAIARAEKRAESHPSRQQYTKMLNKGSVAVGLHFK